jgi:hypothetical protein
MLLKNLQSCPQLLAAFGLGALVSAGVAFAVIQSRAPAPATVPPSAGRFAVSKLGEGSFMRTDSATGEIVFYIFAEGKLSAYELTAVPVQRGGKLP